MTLQSQYTAALDVTFMARVQQALITTANQIASEATTLGVALKSGAITTVPVSPALSVTVAANMVLQVGSEYVTTSASPATSGATTIPLAASQTLANNHPATDTVSPPTDPRHAKRLAYAVLVLANPRGYAELMAQGVASQALDNLSTDVAIQNAVNSLYNAYAGAAS